MSPFKLDSVDCTQLVAAVIFTVNALSAIAMVFGRLQPPMNISVAGRSAIRG